MWKQVDDRKRRNFGECFLLKAILKRVRARVSTWLERASKAGSKLCWREQILTEKGLRRTLVTLRFFEKGAGEFVEEEEPSRATGRTCGQDSVGNLVKLNANFVWSAVLCIE